MCKTWTEEIRSTTESSAWIYLLEEKKSHICTKCRLSGLMTFGKNENQALSCASITAKPEAKASTGINKHFYDDA